MYLLDNILDYSREMLSFFYEKRYEECIILICSCLGRKKEYSCKRDMVLFGKFDD